MKKTILSFAIMIISISINAQCFNNEETTNTNLSAYNDKALEKWKAQTYTDVWGGYVNASLGVTPSHGGAGYYGVTVGGIYRFLDVSATLYAPLTEKKPTLIAGMIGYRYTFNKIFTFVPKIGLQHRFLNNTEERYKDGNRIVYGGEVYRRVWGDVDIIASFYDFRSDKGQDVQKMTNFGIRYSF